MRTAIGVPPGSQIWRVRPIGRVASVGVVLIWGVAAAAGSGDRSVSAVGASVLWVALILVAVAVWRWAFVPFVALTPNELVIQNASSRSTIRYAEIVGAKAGYYGVWIQKRDGTRVRAWAVQKSNAARVAGRHTRADDLIEAIRLRTFQTGSP